MSHVNAFMPLGGALRGNLPNPTLCQTESELNIARQVFGPRPTNVMHGPGTTGKFPKWISPNTFGESLVSESGTILTVGAGSIELGSQSVADHAFIDFHADGLATDFNARIFRVLGTNADLIITNKGTGILQFKTDDTARWRINGTGNLLAETDNLYDIGANLATRPKALYLGSTLRVGPSTEMGSIYIELGDQTAPNVAFIDFHTDGLSTDYNARILRNSGAAGTLQIENVGGASIIFVTSASARWLIAGSGEIQAVTDNVYDIGTSGGGRPKNLYLAGFIVASSISVNGAGGVSVTGGGASILMNGVKVIGVKGPAWAAATTTVNRTAITNATALATLAQQVGTLVNDLRTHGLI